MTLIVFGFLFVGKISKGVKIKMDVEQKSMKYIFIQTFANISIRLVSIRLKSSDIILDNRV